MTKNENSDDNDKISFDTFLESDVGEFGRFQIVVIILIGITGIFSGFMTGDYIFTAARLPHRCVIPECDGPEPEFKPEWISNAVPTDNQGNVDDCLRYDTIPNWINSTNEVCPANLFDKSKTLPCEKYVYGRTNSAVYDFGLECQEWLRALAGTLAGLGTMCGLPIAGYISDNFGRRTTILVYSINMSLLGFIRSFSVNYAMYAALQFLQAAIGGAVFSAGYVLATEVVGLKYRVRTSLTMSTSFSSGLALLGILAYAIPEWRTLSIVLHVPMFGLLLYYWVLSESPRWLLSKNKQEEAKVLFNKMAKMNKKTISDKSLKMLMNSLDQKDDSKSEIKSESSLFMLIIKSPILFRRCCITPIWWMTTSFIYFGLSINTLSLSGNMYFNFIASAVIEIPGYWTAFIILDRFGRKPTLCFGYFLNAICCLAFAFVPENLSILGLILYLVGKYCIALVFSSLYLYTSELYPTRYRHSLLAFPSTVGHLGSILAPLTPPLMDYWKGIPLTMFGAMAFISGLLVLTQPETLGTKLPDTIPEAESLGKSKQNVERETDTQTEQN